MSSKKTESGQAASPDKKDNSFKIAIYVVAAVEAVGLAVFILIKVLN